MKTPISNLLAVKNKDISEKKEWLDLNNIKSKREIGKEIKLLDYNFQDVLCIPLIFDLICQFIDIDDKKYLSFCNKKLYQIYCSQFQRIKIRKLSDKIKIQELLKIYQNINRLDLGKLYELENISFLEKNQNFIELNFSFCKNIKDFTPISYCTKLEILNLSRTTISNISFIQKNKNIIELNLSFC